MKELIKEPEVWKPIQGFEGLYEVSSWGNVRSVDRIVEHPIENLRNKKGKLLQKNILNTGYYYVDLYKCNKRKKILIHRIVYEVFHKYENINFINHKDLDKLNNFYLNLENINNRGNLTHAINKNKTTSKYIGVSIATRTYNLQKKYKASIKINKKSITLGYYFTEEEAHKSYLDALKKYGLENKYANINQGKP